MKNLRIALKRELTENILPFWMDRMPDGDGFLGRIDGLGQAVPDAEKGAILNARILWTFSSAYRILGNKEYLEMAGIAYRYIADHFIDREFGGVYWSLNSDGTPCDTKKQFYAIAFTIYGLAEYYRCCGDKEALSLACSLYRDIEEHSLDRSRNGYIEACTREWNPIEDMRLSDKDQNDAKTMNTHLHILEAYTALLRVWKDESLAEAVRNMICIFRDRIVQPDGHLGLFFDEDFNLTSSMVSYGHDIEASWLLREAAAVLCEAETSDSAREFSESVDAMASRMARAAMEGFTPEGGMEYEADIPKGYRNASRDWWVQAETVVGCSDQYILTGDEYWKKSALEEWDFIKKHIICPDGEWYWSALPDSGGFVPNLTDDRAGFWKCPYHNGRMCMQIIEMFSDFL